MLHKISLTVLSSIGTAYLCMMWEGFATSHIEPVGTMLGILALLLLGSWTVGNLYPASSSKYKEDFE